MDNTGQTVNGTVGTNDADVDAPEAWGVSEGSGNVIVAVIDSGVAYNHSDLLANMWDGTNCKDENGVFLGGCNHGYDFEDNDKTPLPDSSSHGTHIAGIIAAAKNNSKGIIGVSPQAKIMALKYDFTVASEIKAIDFAIQNGAKIINASFTGSGFSTSEHEAINRFRTAGGIVAAAAGNESANNESAHSYPSDYDLDNIISVAATDQNDGLASFSNYGATSIDVGAPGTNIYSTFSNPDLLNETFESVTTPNIPNDWVKGGINNKWATYNFGSDKVLYGQTPSFPYDNNTDSTITSSNYNLGGSTTGATFSFIAKCDTEYTTDYWYDYMQLEYTADGINFYSAIDPYYGGDFKWDEAYLDFLNGDSNQSGGAMYYFENLPIPSQYLTDGFKFQFRWKTDSSVNNYDGCFVDDVKITKIGDGSDNQYGYMQGTSMATPHVAGLAALIWGYRPELTAAQVRDRILQTGDPLASLSGKTVTEKRINAYNALLGLEAPPITGLADDSTPTKSKTWNWDSDDPTVQFRYLIDQTESSVPTGEYSSVKTATQSSGNGIYYIYVQARSDAGIESAVTTVSAILDNTAPAIEITSPLAGSKVNEATTITFTDNELTSPQCSIDNSTWTSCTRDSTALTGLTGFNSLPEGTLSLYIKDTDVAGNTGGDTETGIIKDTTSPTGLITSPGDGSILATAPVFTASASDENGIVSVKFQYKASASSSYTDINNDTSAPYEVDWTGITLTTNTTYNLQIVITDTAGNTTNVSGISFIFDTTAPNAPVVTSPSSPQIVNADNAIITGTAEAGSLVKVKSGSTVVGSQQLGSSETNFSISVPLTQDSTNNFTVTATDIAGNESVQISVPTITEDSTYPSIVVYNLDNTKISPQVSIGTKDTATIDLLFSEYVSYSIKIKNSGGTSVKSWTGNATNPNPKVWDGKDASGSYVADGIYTVEVIITDKADNSITDTSKTITIRNDPLTLNSIGDKSVDEENELTFLAQGNDEEGGILTYALTGEPAGASIDTITGAFSWTPTEAQGPGDYTFTVSVSSSTGASKSEVITVAVKEVNQAPVANDVSISTDEDTAKVVTLSATDTDFPANTLTYSIITGPTNGTLSSLSGNPVTYTPNANYVGADSFTFSVDDSTSPEPTNFAVFKNAAFTQFPNILNSLGLGSFVETPVSSLPATVSITVNPVNDAPVAGDDIVSVDEDTTLTIAKTNLLLNDSDVDGDTLSIVSVSSPVNGSVSMGDNINFVPDTNFNGAASFEYLVSDGTLTDVGTVTITVNPINDIPMAGVQAVTVEEDSSKIIILSGNDIDGDSLTYSIVSGPLHGSLGGGSVNHQVVYNPNPDYTGPDSFEFKVYDGHVDSSPALVTITVTPFNDPPVLNQIGNFSIDELEELTFTANASDPEGATLIYSLSGNPEGTSINSSTGEFSWIPTEGQGPGDYTFSVLVSDGAKTDSEEITITVNEVNQAPTAESAFVSTNEDTDKVISLSASDIDLPANTLTYTIVSGPSHGTVVLLGNTATYTPTVNSNGPDSFTFKANDATADSNEATVSITVTSVNDAPVASNDSVSTNEDTDKLISLIATDIETPAESLTYSIVSIPTHGTVSLSGNIATYTPSLNENGFDSFTFKVNDGTLDSDTATVTLTIFPVNDAPLAEDDGDGDILSTDEDTALTIAESDFLANDSDVDAGDTLFVADIFNPTNGTVEISGSEVIFTPTSNFNGDASFEYSVSDGTLTDIGLVNIEVNPVNDAPIADSQEVEVGEDGERLINLSAEDIEEDELAYLVVAGPANGFLSTISENQLIYSPNANFNGSDSFTFKANDGEDDSNTATVSIDVNPVNDAPVANDGVATTSQEVPVTVNLSANDIDGDSLTYSIDTNVSKGTLSAISDNHNITYTPNSVYVGSDSFTFKANDGTVDSNIATVSITVNPPPVISNEANDTPGETSVTVTWTTDHPSTSRVIYDTVSHATLDVAPNYGYANSTSETDTSPKVTSHSVTIGGLVAGTTYYYRVVSHGSPEVVGDENTFTTKEKVSGGEVAGTSTTSSTSSVCSDQKPGSAPVLISIISSGLNEVTLTWAKASDPVSYYLIAFGTKPGEMLYGNPFAGGKDTTSYTVKGLSSGTRYYFRVRAGNNCMPGDFSNELSAVAYGEVLSEIPEGFAPGVLGEEDTTSGEVLGKENVSPTLEISPLPQSQDGKGLLGGLSRRNTIFAGIGIILLAAGYYFFLRRRRE